MVPSLLWYLAALAAMPIILAGVLWLARQDMRRTLTVLSATALGIGLANALILTQMLKSAASSQDVIPAGGDSFGPNYYLATLELWYTVIFALAWTLQSAAWVLALYHAIQARRGRWLALIVACAVVSSLATYFASNLYTMTYLASVAPLSVFISLHPYGSLFTVGVLSMLASGATLLYARLGVLAVPGVRAKANGLVPGAVRAPTREARAAVLQADEAPEDVVFVVEDVPRGRG